MRAGGLLWCAGDGGRQPVAGAWQDSEDGSSAAARLRLGCDGAPCGRVRRRHADAARLADVADRERRGMPAQERDAVEE